MKSSTFAELVRFECERVAVLHPPYANRDEAYGVLAEEFDEVRREVYASPRDRDDAALLGELVQLSSCACRWFDSTSAAILEMAEEASASLVVASKGVPSDHESLTRLERIVERLREGVVGPGSRPGGVCDPSVPVRLVELVGECGRWAATRGLVAPHSPGGAARADP